MHKGRDLFKDDYSSKSKLDKIVNENRTVFLDIDGVIQPGTQKRFDHDNKKLKEYLYKKYNDPRYLDVKDYDIGAVYYDWSPSSVGFLREILDSTVSNIVLSSDWRDTNFDYLKAFFKLYDLEDYLIDVTNPNIFMSKKDAIKKYLEEHKEIKKYIILDDLDFYDDFGPNFRKINNCLCNSDLRYALYLFNVDNDAVDTDNLYMFKDVSIKKQLFEIDNKKVLYLYDFYMKYNCYINETVDYIIADIFYKNKDIDLLLFNNELKLDLTIGYNDRYGLTTVNRNINSSIFSDELENIKCKILKKVR